ncbi:MAG: DUF2232 domain-containing protein [Tissierellia bacterium]|nr:DUF2232 domain-containing protein [Tissierellia bacterium]
MKRENNKNKKIIEILLAVAISTIGMLLGIYYLPLQFLIFLYGIPFIVIGVKYEINISIISMIISILAIGLVTDYISGISLLITFLPLSISLIYAIKSRRKPLEIMTISTIVLIVSFFIIFSIMGNVTGISIVNQMDEFFTQVLNTQLELLGEMELSPHEIFRFKDSMEDKINEILLQIPSMIMIFSLIMTYINYLISVLILRKLGYGIVYIPRFSRFKLPNNILLGVGIMFLGTFLLKIFKLSYYETIFMNITLLASFVFFVQGLAVIDYKLKEKKRNLFLRLIVILFFILVLPLGTYIAFLGVLDVIFDFRKIRKPV